MFRQLIACLLLVGMTHAWTIIPATTTPNLTSQQRKRDVTLSMGLFDSISDFLQDRQGDFVKMDQSSQDVFGPGPALLLYHVPNGIDDSEIQDVLSDGAPKAFRKGVILARLDETCDSLLDQSVQDALNQVVSGQWVSSVSLATDAGVLASGPVLFFSGFTDAEMMATYTILGQEIYQETGGQVSPACAKAVPNAIQKPLRQVFEEILGDHQNAMKMEAPEK
jgi:hypothetical protein